MKITELIGVKKFHKLSDTELSKHIASEYGLGWLGMGTFGIVIGSPDPNWVYKIFDNDLAYLKYLQYTQQHPNKFFPKVKKIKQLHSFYNRTHLHNDMFYVAVIERLYPMQSGLLEFIIDLQIYAGEYDFYTFLTKEPDILPNGQDNTNEWSFEEINYKWPWVLDFAKAWKIITQLNIPDSFVDGNSGNFMQRKDGTPVIIDPVAPDGLATIYQSEKRTLKPTISGPIYRKK